MSAPKPGENVEFDEIVRKTWDGLTEAGNPEGIDDETVRERTAAAYASVGKTFETPTVRDWPEDHEHAEARPSQQRVLRIPTPSAEPYWYEDPAEAEFIEHYVLSRRALGARVHGGLLITGPSGQGKTMGVIHAIDSINAAHHLSIPLLVMDCATVTDPQKWFGRREIDDEGSRYETSDFVQAVENGSAILLDDVKRLHPHIHNPIMNLFAGLEQVTLSDLNVVIKRHPETVFFGTANEGAVFGGNHRMDYAMEERWPFHLERGFPPPLEEITILTRNWGITDDEAGNLVAIAGATRGMWETGDLRAPISTRTLDSAAFLVAGGMTVRESLTRTALGLYEASAGGTVGMESEREKVKQIIDGKMRR